MKKTYLTLIACTIIVSNTYAQWTTGTNISNTNSGVVSIGTTATGQQLNVGGNIGLTTGGYIFGDTSVPYLWLNQTNGTVLAYGSTSVLNLLGSVTTLSAGSNYLGLITNGSERLRIDNAGKVGIGTPTPGALLDVNGSFYLNRPSAMVDAGPTLGTSSYINLVPTGMSASNAAYAGIGFPDNNTVGMFTDYDGNIRTSGTSFRDIQFGRKSAPYLTIKDGGNVGIGALIPRGVLDVGKFLSSGALGTILGRLSEGDSTTEGTMLGVRGYTTSVSSPTYVAKSFALEHVFYGVINSSVSFYRGPDVTGGFMTFNTDNNNEKMRITSSGNVGIGATDPISLFQVDDGCTKASIGDASGSTLNYGTSYFGFNASRTPSHTWILNSDGIHNGGGVIYSSIGGDMYFAPVDTSLSSGSSSQTIPDTVLTKKIALHISPSGVTYAKQIVVQSVVFPDYVFKRDYALMPLADLKTYVDRNHHLPEVPSEEEVTEKGLNLGEMNKILVKKVEELTLYLIEKDKEMKSLEYRLELLEKQKNK